MEKVYVIVLLKIEYGKKYWKQEFIHKTLDGARKRAVGYGYSLDEEGNNLYIRGERCGYIQEWNLNP